MSTAEDRIWEAVAREQEALAGILEQELRKTKKSADMLDTVPNNVDPDNDNLRIRKVIRLEQVISEVVRSTAEKERAIAKKLCAVQGNCPHGKRNDDDDDDFC